MKEKRKGLSIPSILTIVLTIVVLAGCVSLYAAFHSDADIPMTTMKMAGLLSDAFLSDTSAMMDENVKVTTMSLPPLPAATAAPTMAPVMATPNPEVTLTLAGMAAFESNIGDSTYDKQTQSCNYQAVLQDVAAYNTGHIRIAVMPQALTAKEHSYSDQQANPSAALALRTAGFNVAILEADAVLKGGAQTAVDTADALYQNGMAVSGVNAKNASQMLMLEQNGIRMAIIGYSEKLSTQAANTLQSAAGNNMLTADNMAELELMIENARNQGCQLVLVYIHWQNTDADKITDSMRLTAKDITAAGADIIVGTGIKRLLPAAWLSTADENGDNRRSLTLYSMGSLLTESRDGYDLSGALVHVKAKAKGSGAEITGLSYEPTYIWKQNMQGETQYRVIVGRERPERMKDDQWQVMQRCNNRTDESLKNTLILAEKE